MSHTRFSDGELKALLNDERNCVKLQKDVKHISLHPFYLNNLAAGIAENLNKIVSKYDKSLKGIILAYKKPRLRQANGVLHNDKGSIFVDVEAEFYIFCPQENCHVKAIVNKTGQDHIGCLIHKAFNISVPKTSNEMDWKGKFVKIGDEILIKINYVDMFYIIPYIKGEIVNILTKSIKSEIDYDSGVSTSDHHSKTPKNKSKLKKFNTLTDSSKFVEDAAANTLLSVQPDKEKISKKTRKSLINSLIQESNANIFPTSNTENKDDIDITHSTAPKVKSKRRRNTMNEMTPAGDEVLENNTIITKNSLVKNKHNKSNGKIEIDSSPISSKLKIKKDKNDDILDKSNELSKKLMKKRKIENDSSPILDHLKEKNDDIFDEGNKLSEKLKKNITIEKDSSPILDNLIVKNPAFTGEKKSKKIKSVSPNEISKTIDAKPNAIDESKLEVRTSTDDKKLSKKIKIRRQTVSELLPWDNLKNEENKKHNKLNRSLEEHDLAVDRNPHKSKKTKKSKSTISEIDDDIQKLLESVLKERTPKKQAKSLLTDQSSSLSNLTTSSKKRKKKDSIETTEIYENKIESTPRKHETLDESESGLKKRKHKRTKLNSPNEKYPSLQLNTPHYANYIPSNEVSTFHDSISPIKMKDRPNLSSPETKKYTSPAGSERRLSTGSKKPERSYKKKLSISNIHTDLIGKYLK